MDLVQAMKIFSLVAEAESFTQAAEKLDLSVPVVTRIVGKLEAHLNVRLLNRTTRRVALTEVGHSYLERCREVLALIDESEKDVARATQDTQGSLRILTGTSFALAQLAPVLSAYHQKYPNIRVQLVLSDSAADLIEDRIDAGIMADYLLKSETLIVRPLLTYSYVVVASPAYINSTVSPASPADLKTLCFIGRPADLRGQTLNFHHPLNETEATVSVTPHFVCNSAMMLKNMVLEGMGYAILPRVFVEQHIAEGSLVPLIAPWSIAGNNVQVCLAYQSRKHISRPLRTFINHIIEEFS